MDYITVNASDSGIALAWIAATMGVKSNRLVKKTIREVSIPKVCEAVSVLAAKKNHLRLTSNLLYGVSLIFRLKVAAMESEVLDVNFRLQTPIFSGAQVQKQAPARPSLKIARLSEDSRFNMDTDFFPDFLEHDVPSIPLKQMELLLNNFGKKLVGGERMDIEGRIDEDVTNDYQNETNISVDFEFDLMGNIIEKNGSEPILDLLDTEENFAALRSVVEDISKSLNTLSYDQHFTTLDIGRLTVAESHPQKKRRVRIVIDEITTFAPTVTEEPRKIVRKVGTEDIYRQLSLMLPNFLNLNREILYPNLPSVQEQFRERRRNFGFWRDVEIERGRDFPGRRSLNVFDAIANEFNFDDLDFNFLTEAAHVPRTVEPETRTNAPETENQQKLKDFAQFLRERMAEVSELPVNGNSMNKPIETGDTDDTNDTDEPILDGWSFESLLPCKVDANPAVTRRVAANSFSFMLQLASQGELMISGGETHPNSPSDVHVKFLDEGG